MLGEYGVQALQSATRGQVFSAVALAASSDSTAARSIASSASCSSTSPIISWMSPRP
jgi:hypothetical protein